VTGSGKTQLSNTMNIEQRRLLIFQFALVAAFVLVMGIVLMSR
jgi:hypothetical protein